MRLVRVAALAAMLLGSCAPKGPAAPLAPQPATEGSEARGTAPAPRTPAGTLTTEQAKKYMVELINRDRASVGLGPVALDPGAPSRSGQRHADDMAAHGYTGHYGTDGSVPEQRYTEAGGVDMVMENASCFVDERGRALDAAPRIEARAVEEVERLFFGEKPPNDGHRRNILTPRHDKVGIGMAQPRATATEVPSPCVAQEFVDAYGTYAPAPRQMRLGASLHIEGAISAPATFAGVALARVDAPSPIDVAELNRRHSYAIPAPFQSYWPAGYQTPIVVQTAGPRFVVDVPVNDGGKRGMYELSVWAKVPSASELVMVSLRTILVR
jgi:uncharacterized protein YkwD